MLSRAFALGLMRGVGVGALLLAGSSMAQAADSCVLSAETLTCAADQGSGIRLDDDDDVTSDDAVTQLVVQGLTKDIAPGSGVGGIRISAKNAMALDSDTGKFIITTYGKGAHGIHVSNYETAGGITVDHTGGVVTANGMGILVDSAGTASLTSSGSIHAGDSAILVKSYDSGTAGVDHSGAIISDSGYGVYVEGTGDTSLTFEGSVNSKADGLFAKSSASGSVTIDNSGPVEAWNGYGIQALAADGKVSVTNDGNVAGKSGAIKARSGGSGADDTVTIESEGTLNAWSGVGIDASSAGGALTVTNKGAIESSSWGILASNGGSGATADVIIDQTGNINAAKDGAIRATAGSGKVDIKVDGDVFSNGDTIYATSGGSSVEGTISIVYDGKVTSGKATGIFAKAGEGDVDISGTGDISAFVDGIYGRSGGKDVTVDHTGTIGAATGYGVFVEAPNGGATLTLDGAITAELAGIWVDSANAIVVDHKGALTSNTAEGIRAQAYAGSVSVTGDGDLVAQTTGIYAEAQGSSGDVSVSHKGSVTAWDEDAIVAISANGKTSVTQTGNVLAQGNGITATATGETGGSVIVNQTGTVTAWDGYAIKAHSAHDLVSVTSDGAIVAGLDGIVATSTGDGQDDDVTVSHEGDITANGGTAIHAQGVGGTTSVTSTGNLIAEAMGIYAQTSGEAVLVDNEGAIQSKDTAIYAKNGGTTDSSGITLVQDGAVTSSLGSGLHAEAGTGAVSITSTGNISAFVDGIYGRSGGKDVTVDHTGTIGAATGYGVFVEAPNGGATLTLDGAITAELAGIWVDSANAIVVDHKGALTSNTAEGIRAQAYAGSVSVTGDGDLVAKTTGIYAEAQGSSGDVSVSHKGSVTAWDEDAIVAISANGKTSVTQTGNVLAQGNGITATATGETGGSVIVNQTGTVTAWDGYAIKAHSAHDLVSVTSDGAIVAGLDGIVATSTGDGQDDDVTVSHEGDITANGGTAIHAQGVGGTTSVTSTGNLIAEAMGIYAQTSGEAVLVDNEGTIQSKDTGIYAKNGGTTDSSGITLVQDGAVTSSLGSGLHAEAGTGAVSITSTGNISAFVDGIYGRSGGKDVTVDHTGTIGAATGYGVFVEAPNGGATLTLDGAITAELAGIWVDSANAIVVDHKGALTSNTAEGIRAQAYAGSVSVTGDGDLVAQTTGIYAEAQGSSGDVSVSHKGSVTAWDEDAIVAISANGKTSVTQTGNVLAQGNGITATATGSSNAAVIVNQTGTVTAWDGYAIKAHSAHDLVSVTSDGAIVAGLDGIVATSTGDGQDDDVTVSHEGDITANGGTAIHAQGVGGTTSVTSTGNLIAEAMGIYAHSADGSVEVLSDGTIVAKTVGIHAQSNGNADVTINHTGDVTAWDEEGIYGHATGGAIDITLSGKVIAKLDAITAVATGPTSKATVTVTGDLESYDGYGINANASHGLVYVLNTGNIVAKLDGIFAKSTGETLADVTIDHTGTIVSYSGSGISANAAFGLVDIKSVGELTAELDGIRAISTGQGALATVTVSQVGDVTVYNGSAIFAEASEGNVSITLDGDVTGGEYGIQARAKSTAASLEIVSGTISGAGKAAVYLDAITSAKVDNYGTIDGGVGNAIWFDGYGTNQIDNYGTLIGDLELFGAYTTFNNQQGGTVNAGAWLDFHGAGVFRNAGHFAPGGDDVTATTSINGDFVQTATGHLQIDVDLVNGTNDLVAVSGTADLNGSLGFKLTEWNGTMPADMTVLTSTGLQAQNLTVSNVALSGVLSYVNGTDVVLTVNGFDFDPGQGGTLGTYLNSAMSEGSPDLNSLFAALGSITDQATYDQAIAELTTDTGGQSGSSTVTSNIGFADRMLSCRVSDGAFMFTAEGECVWVSSTGSSLEYDDQDGNLMFARKAMTTAAGAQIALDKNWRLGGALGYTASAAQSINGSTDGEQVQAGIVVKYDHEDTLLAASVTGGYGSYDSARTVTVDTIVNSLMSNNDMGFLSGRLHAAHTFAFDSFYFRPLADLDLTYLDIGAIEESGGVTALSVDETGHWVATFSPALEVGGEFRTEAGNVMRPFARLGAVLTAGADISRDARLVAGNSDAGTFEIVADGDEFMVKFGAGIDFITEGDATLRVMYEGVAGELSSQHSASVKLGASF